MYQGFLPPTTTNSSPFVTTSLSPFTGTQSSAFHQISPNYSPYGGDNSIMGLNGPSPCSFSPNSNFLVRGFLPGDLGLSPMGLAEQQGSSPSMDDGEPTTPEGDSPLSPKKSITEMSEKVMSLARPPVSPGLCSICHDRATGKHYGANSCDGCKGFFRRTVRKNQQYTCRFDRKCVIDRDKRNSCRFCRFKKCLTAGMKRDAVQNERDRILTRKSSHISAGIRSPGSMASSKEPSRSSSPVSTTTNFQDYIDILMRAEAYYNASHLRATVITRTSDHMPSPTLTTVASGSDEQQQQSKDETQSPKAPIVANVHDISESMQQQLLLMVEWAKTLSPFYELLIDDQISLLRNYAAQHLLICVAYRSRHAKNQLLLTNCRVLPRDVSSEIPDVNHVIVRVLDEIVRPMNELQIDETEFVCLRAIVFFNPNAKGLEDNLQRVRDTRQGILSALQQYCASQAPQDSCRMASLLLLLPPLQAIAQSLIEDVQLASLFGITKVDSLLNELLLAGMETGDPGQNGRAGSPFLPFGDGPEILEDQINPEY